MYDDIYFNILNSTDIKYVWKWYGVAKKFGDMIDGIVRNKMNYIGMLNLNIFSREEIKLLYRSFERKVVSGDDHTLIINNGEVNGYGCNNNYQLGNPIARSDPTLINNLKDITDVCVGDKFSLFLNSKGKVYLCGSFMNTIIKDPTLITENIIQISCFENYYLILDNGGKVYGNGYNRGFRLGKGPTFNTHETPRLISGLHNIIQISCGMWYTLYLDISGRVYFLGRDNYNSYIMYDSPLLIDVPEKIIKIASGAHSYLLLDVNGNVYSNGGGISKQLCINNLCKKHESKLVLIPELNNIKEISCGDCHSLYLHKNGNVYVMGNNHYGQLGIPTITDTCEPIFLKNNIKHISCGRFTSYLIDNDDNIHSFGDSTLENIPKLR
jgi:alpha-tubulin suppressor-like RCC1 family protein